MRAFDAILRMPWAIRPEWLRTLGDIAQRRGVDPKALAADLGRPLEKTYTVTVRDGVATIPIIGPIFPRANMFELMSGATSLQLVAADFAKALDDPGITAVILDIDSPGGVAFGPGEFAGMVRAAAKPVVAYVGGMGCSAAYWIASAADEVVVNASALVGSIGVVVAAEVQEKADRDGYRQFDIVSSNAPDKRPDLSTEEGVAKVRATLDDLESEFIGDVAAFRGVTRETVIARFGGGDVVVGARAVAAGMADRVGTYEDVLAGLAGRQGAGSSGPFTQAEETPMSGTEAKPAKGNPPAVTAEMIAADHPEVAEHFRAEGRKAGLAEGRETRSDDDYDQGVEDGAKAERERIAAIDAMTVEGCEDLAATAKADGTSATDFAVAQSRWLASPEGKHLRNLQAADVLAAGVEGSATTAGAGGKPAAPAADAPLEERAKAEWDKDEGLKAEFGGRFETYLAYRKAEADGKVRRLSRPAS